MISEAPQPLKWYGLKQLGYDESVIPMTNDPIRDQIAIETLAYRIGHKPEEGGLGPFGHFKAYVDLVWNAPESPSMIKFIWNTWANRMLTKACEEDQLGVAGPTSAGKSSPFGLYAVVSYTTDPTHTLVLVMSTSIAGAKKRIWRNVVEYWEAVPGLPGRLLKSTNEIRGLSYDGQNYGESSGIYLIASEQSNEKAALDKLIGIKAPRTGNSGASFEELMAQPEYADLRHHFNEDTLRDLVPRLQNLSQDRIGKLLLVIDEATGAVASILNAVNTNLRPGNVGHFQVILLGNPNLPYDSFGTFCQPEGGWDKVDLLRDEEWRTTTGGLCIRFNGEQNPRITGGSEGRGNERLSWMLRKEDIDAMAHKYGRESLFYHRMVLGTWCLNGGESGIYAPADIELSGSREKLVVWKDKPVPVSFLDPSFTAGGDRAFPTFGLIGTDGDGKQVLLRTGTEVIRVDVNNTSVPVNFQIVRQWKRMCEARGILPQNAAYDRTGGGIPFGDIVSNQWSPLVLGFTSAGPATKAKLHGETHPGTKKPVLACERFANRATEIWYSAHPFFRSQQLRGVNEELAKELCSRQHAKGRNADGRTIQVEPKRTYKDREGKSPDESDSFLGLVDFCKIRHQFRPAEFAETAAAAHNAPGGSAWKQFREKALKYTRIKQLKRK